MPAPERLRQQQARLAAHVRDPDHEAPPPGIEDRRLKVYRELFYNSLQGLLAGNFPVIRRLLGDDGWHALVRDFYREHRAATPLFPELPREFIQYLQEREPPDATNPPWLVELAHYEWAELALDLHDGPLGLPASSGLQWQQQVQSGFLICRAATGDGREVLSLMLTQRDPDIPLQRPLRSLPLFAQPIARQIASAFWSARARASALVHGLGDQAGGQPLRPVLMPMP